MNTVVVGTQWGDEGKGKIIDYFSRKVDLVVRYQGGNNAGHTVYRYGKKIVMHLVPSGILEKKVRCIISGGVVIDPEALVQELDELRLHGIRFKGRLLISEQAHIIFPFHKVYDQLREEKKGFIKIGTTGKGIGPCYSDRAARSGIRIADLYETETLRKRLALSLKEKNEIFRKLYGFRGFSFEDLYRKYLRYRRILEPYVADTVSEIHKAIDSKKNILLEGAQGTMLDLDQGTYPFVTSSFTVSGGACVGTGLPPTAVHQVIGVTKAYTTRVGEGPFPTEFSTKFMDEVREKGAEYGATTGRPRRCGWLDGVILEHAMKVNGITEIALTKLDVLDTFKEIKVATGYRYKGRILKKFPSGVRAQREIKPIYRTFPGWNSSTGACRRFKDLPVNARRYIHELEKISRVRIGLISVGTARDQMIQR